MEDYTVHNFYYAGFYFNVYITVFDAETLEALEGTVEYDGDSAQLTAQEQNIVRRICAYNFENICAANAESIIQRTQSAINEHNADCAAWAAMC